MTYYGTLLQTVKGISPVAIVGAALVQLVFAIIWFNFIVKNVANYYLAADKGVRRVEHILHRYSTLFCTLATFVCGVARALVIVTGVAVMKGSTLEDYHVAALLLTAVTCINQHHSFWCQRPLPLLLTDLGYEVTAALLASVSYYVLSFYGF
ncbi:hypothetical protein ERJ75_001741700 [Trypanosoma vivax]|uniref:Uncharacterized protein n=1 Tax=Trypanosoma vivax (strain Y486) TaxID=1055687 RepID=G0U2V3_TRYVY|nr:hypothetical protein TRVL_01940 [Trypanosoma vivax]KAH8604225.1 hypothetical protein ERJ75_001741700 [Trypanosoma vivax]CCC50607.1 conserved hypothetical protein [Trypanosoma vivax Y486]